MQVIPSQFASAGADGDFGWMIERPEYADALFIFNDNEEQFRAFVRDATPGSSGCAAGGGNALIRPYRCADPPRAAGIPTGVGGRGYPSLSPEVRGVLDESLAVVRDLVATGRYERIYYSADADGLLASRIFAVAVDVKRYITDQLRGLA